MNLRIIVYAAKINVIRLNVCVAFMQGRNIKANVACTELCKGVRYCWNSFSVKVCPGDVAIDDRLRGLSAFELCMELCRGDGCAVPFDLYGVTSAELTPEEWVFNITDAQAVKRLRQCEA